MTSREPLHLAGEREHPLRPIPEAPAVELFRQRADAVLPGFDGDYAQLAEICRRLDGLPLAIELAAARLEALDVGTLGARLEPRLPLLTGRSRDVPERQRTLRATIEWSYDLLDDDERRVFRALGVFAGGWTAEAADEVAGAELDVLESLVDKSLVRHLDGRYAMLETIREYAAARLDERPEYAEARDRHARYFGALAEHLDRNELEAFEVEHGNFRAALTWLGERGEAEAQLRLAAALAFFGGRAGRSPKAGAGSSGRSRQARGTRSSAAAACRGRRRSRGATATTRRRGATRRNASRCMRARWTEPPPRRSSTSASCCSSRTTWRARVRFYGRRPSAPRPPVTRPCCTGRGSTSA